MPKTKLRKFEENKKLKTLLEPRIENIKDKFAFKGKWNTLFKNDNPIILELGCGKAEYTINLAKRFQNKNFIGIDIKGDRIWQGAKEAQEQNICNAFFIRTNVELISHIFCKNEIEEIWITFPDPQIKNRHAKKRLINNKFIDLYKNILAINGKIHLKTDNQFLYGYALGVIQSQKYNIIINHHDIYNNNQNEFELAREIKTYYEKKFLSENLPISYIQFSLN